MKCHDSIICFHVTVDLRCVRSGGVAKLLIGYTKSFSLRWPINSRRLPFLH